MDSVKDEEPIFSENLGGPNTNIKSKFNKTSM